MSLIFVKSYLNLCMLCTFFKLFKFFCCLSTFFSKLTFFQIFLSETISESRSGQTFCQSWSGSKLITKWQKVIESRARVNTVLLTTIANAREYISGQSKFKNCFQSKPTSAFLSPSPPCGPPLYFCPYMYVSVKFKTKNLLFLYVFKVLKISSLNGQLR